MFLIGGHVMHPDISYILRSFECNRSNVEERLRQVREYINELREARRHKKQLPWITRVLLMVCLPFDGRLYLRQVRECRHRIRFYKQVESDLRTGDLQSAIDALAEFCPAPETTRQTIRRIVHDRRLSPLDAALRSPTALREAMLQARRDLMRLQQAH